MDELPFLISQEQLLSLITNVKDWQLNQGSLIKLVPTEEEHTVLSRPIGTTLYPTFFPRDCFETARKLQTVYNQLYSAVACDDEWLHQALSPLLQEGSFASKLWAIHQEVKQTGYLQDLSLGLFRSDYMLHSSPGTAEERPHLKQVEFNTYSCAGLVHSSRVSAMHRHLCRAGFYNGIDTRMALSALPTNDTVPCLVGALVAAHKEYGESKCSTVTKTGILMIVQPMNINVCDERPIEYALWDMNVPMYRVKWGIDVLQQTVITPSGELLFYSSTQDRSFPVEISLVYLRAGYDEAEYDPTGVDCRLRLERSRAIICPSVLSHLTGFKVVQQALTSKDALSRFLPPDEAARVASTFAPIYPLDDSLLGTKGRNLASDSSKVGNYVLKPSLEGGGHNIYRDDIPAFLRSVPPELWKTFILMEMITPPLSRNLLLSPMELYTGPTESELGILGACMWRKGRNREAVDQPKLLLNVDAGFSLKTKAKGVNEMSVIKGYGCFDSPCLTDHA